MEHGAEGSLTEGKIFFFDAANNPIMGMIVDRTRTKQGKMRPYLLFAPIPIAITTIHLFRAPGFASDGAEIAYAASCF